MTLEHAEIRLRSMSLRAFALYLLANAVCSFLACYGVTGLVCFIAWAVSR